MCAKMALGLGGSLARTHPPPDSKSALASHQLSVNAVPEIPRCQLGPRLALGASSGAPSPSLPTLPRDVPTYAAPTPVNSSCSHPAGYEETLTRLAAILAKHFADTRIVGTGEVPFRGLGGVGMGWHLWLAIFCTKCWPDGHEAWGPGLMLGPC